MANKQLLDCVNEILKRTRVIDTANIGLLASLTSTSIQGSIDIAVQVVNEGIDELYTASDMNTPNVMAESTITLATGTREYTLPATFLEMTWPMVDRTNTQYLYEWTDSYNNFLLLDPQQNFTGLPIFGIISPITGSLRVDRAPDSTVNGNIYTFEYFKDLVLTNSSDTVPFNNRVFRSMVPVWVQLYKRESRNEFDQALYQINLGRASRALMEEPMMTSYNPRMGYYQSFNPTDPFMK